MTLKILAALTLLAGAVQAQSVTGKAFGTYVNVAGIVSQSPIATLPSTGGMATGQADAFGVAGSVDEDTLLSDQVSQPTVYTPTQAKATHGEDQDDRVDDEYGVRVGRDPQSPMHHAQEDQRAEHDT